MGKKAVRKPKWSAEQKAAARRERDLQRVRDRDAAEIERMRRPKEKPEWVRTLEGSGHQYIGGWKPGTSPRNLTPEERRASRAEWKARANKLGSRDDGKGKQVRPDTMARIGDDYGHMIGDAPIVATRAQQEKSVADAARKARDAARTPRVGPMPMAHDARHTHTSACTTDDECARNRNANGVPSEDTAVYAPFVTNGHGVRARKSARNRNALMAQRRDARRYPGGVAVKAPTPDTDEHGNLIQSRVAW